MVKIRLRRVGAKKQPSYRIVVADGFYNPRTEPETVKVEEERALYWLGVGAQPSEPVARLLKKQGTMARFERLKQGEPLETLLAEANEAAQAAPEISPKTRRGPAERVAEEPAPEPEPEPVEAAGEEEGETEE
jgi:small subunit ribosomal protein S16